MSMLSHTMNIIRSQFPKHPIPVKLINSLLKVIIYSSQIHFVVLLYSSKLKIFKIRFEGSLMFGRETLLNDKPIVHDQVLFTDIYDEFDKL